MHFYARMTYKYAVVIRVSLVGASGYVGGELVRLLHGHPHAKLVGLYASQERRLTDLFPNLRGVVDEPLRTVDPERLSRESDLVMLSVPHSTAAPLAAQLTCRVIDLSGDLRLKDPVQRQQLYGDSALEAVYGLPELHRAELRDARIVANPGCYPTATILALRPLAKAGLIAGPAIVDAKSGVSGAGRGATDTTHFCHVNENLRPYNIGVHRHQPEMEQEIGHPVLFAPHLAPMTRGILATCYATLTGEVDLHGLYQETYKDEPFVRLLPPGELPQTRATYGSNFCDLAVYHDPRGVAVVVSAIDNLGKGAAGQAVQNLNAMFGLPETEGLWAPAIFV